MLTRTRTILQAVSKQARRRRAIPALAAGAGTCLAMVLSTVMASAQPAGAATSALRLAAANPTTSQAGYFVTTAPATASASVKFKVPALTCTSTTSAMAPGAFLFISTGAPTGAAVIAECSGGAPVYAGVLVINGSGPNTKFTPAAGDVMVAKASESASAATVTLTDVTQGKSQKATGAGATVGSLVDGIDSLNSNGSNFPIPAFSKMGFSTGKEDGMTVAAAGGVAFDMKLGTVVQIHTGALNTAGNAWSEIFKHS